LWKNSEEWYKKRSIPWKRGWLLYGPGGTGKTALARAFAEDLDLPIFVYNLAELGNMELLREWKLMQANVPCIALIEDLDNVFHGRENVVSHAGGNIMSLLNAYEEEDEFDPIGIGSSQSNKKKKRSQRGTLTFDVFLNCLSGIENHEGIFTIITTNDISKIDEALGRPTTLPDGTNQYISTRPGRIDKAIELTYMEPEGKKRMAQRILGMYEKEYLDILHFIEQYPTLQETPAQFQERCSQIALRCYWKELDAASCRTLKSNGKKRSSLQGIKND
jgi:SpoVK/Ycf46/Vps4 family AAA+-type ATPase